MKSVGVAGYDRRGIQEPLGLRHCLYANPAAVELAGPCRSPAECLEYAAGVSPVCAERNTTARKHFAELVQVRDRGLGSPSLLRLGGKLASAPEYLLPRSAPRLSLSERSSCLAFVCRAASVL